MFTTNLFEIKLQQEETQRRAAQMRLVKSLETSRGSSSKPSKRVVSPTWMVQQETCTLVRAAY